MEKKEAIEIIIEATKGNTRKEDFFKLPNEIIGDVLDEYAKAINKNSVMPDISESYCPKCENPYPHIHKNGGKSCDECGYTWS